MRDSETGYLPPIGMNSGSVGPQSSGGMPAAFTTAPQRFTSPLSSARASSGDGASRLQSHAGDFSAHLRQSR